jgi:hypothetical protein
MNADWLECRSRDVDLCPHPDKCSIEHHGCLGRELERKSIVEWLRKNWEYYITDVKANRLADAIECGEHRTEK